jgi:hypothetical protein
LELFLKEYNKQPNKIYNKSVTIDTFFERSKIDLSKYNFWNFDIQGAELMALKGATKSIKYAKDDYFYFFSDGITDQFGGPDSKKLMKKVKLRLISTKFL